MYLTDFFLPIEVENKILKIKYWKGFETLFLFI